jgi:uncharacterized SAM-binding protein YcdF (DUF218 family)
VNSLFVLLGIESWKPVIAALLLPPVPLLLLTLVGARLILWRRGVGWMLLLLSVVGLWFSASAGLAEWMLQAMLNPPPVLSRSDISELKKEAAGGHTAIVVLGGGRQAFAPEYSLSGLAAPSLERLRYGIWLSRETGAPIAFSGGVGHGAASGPPEAEIAARIAASEFGRPLRWTEEQSRDTRENAMQSLAVLKPAGVTKIVLVTHKYHMRRALRSFREAAERSGGVEVVAAPMDAAPHIERPVLRWLPSSEGCQLMRQVLREAVGLLMGA